jgi:hypothetical protein
VRRSLSLILLSLLALVVSLPAHAQDSPSLGDLARQAQKDREKNKGDRPSAKVLTNDDVPSASSGGPAPLGAGLGEIGQPSAESKSGASPSPAEKIAMVEAVMNKLDTLDRATLARNVLQGKDVDFPGRSRWEEKLFAAKQVYVAQGRELVQKARQIVDSAEGLKGNQDPNDPRVKELGAKLQALVHDAVQMDAAFQAVMLEGRDLAGQSGAH